jgi:hypothetical protein
MRFYVWTRQKWGLAAPRAAFSLKVQSLFEGVWNERASSSTRMILVPAYACARVPKFA